MQESGPQTDDELHQWVIDNIGVNIPRTAVCHDHCAPFTFLADLYFERIPSGLAMANRGGAKTFIVAVLHYLNSTYKPGCESLTFGATEAQANRCYGHIEDWCYDKDEHGKRLDTVKSFIRGKPLKSLTTWKTGAKIEIVAGSEKAVSGPHPAKSHADEIDQMDEAVWNQAQPIDTWIPTPDGWKQHGNLKVGDEVFGRDGKPTKIVKVMDLGVKDIYEVSLTDGRSTRSCADHLWVVGGSTQIMRDKWKVLPLHEIIKQGVSYWREDKSGPRICYRFGIPQGDAVDFDEVNLEVDPYTLGLILGDGHIGRTDVTFRSEDQFVIDKVASLVGTAGYEVNGHKDGEYKKYRIRRQDSSVPGYASLMVDLGLEGARSHDKFIPEDYKYSSRQQRIEILRGLFDADASVRLSDGVIEYWTISEQLAIDAQEIVLSLGGRAIMRSYFDHYTLDVSLSDDDLVSLPRKVERLRHRRGNLHPRIKSVTPAGQATVRCIGVDNEDGTYRTEDYIVTHNSRGMAVSNPATGPLPEFMERFNGMIPPQDVATSTRNSLKGLMHELLEEVQEDIKNDEIPQYTVYIWCIFECLQQIPNCRNAPDDERKELLNKLGMDPELLCDCANVSKGVWGSEAPIEQWVGKRRTLEHVCAKVEGGKVVNGKAFLSRGWKPPIDFIQTFKRNTPGTWMLQHECREGKDENNYIERWSLDEYGIRGYKPLPEFGPIYESVDWGTTHPACVLLYQYTTADVPALDFNYEPIYISAGTYILFHEIYVTGLGPDGLAKRVVDAENMYRQAHGPGWKIAGRFCDPQGKGERITFSNHGLSSSWPAKSRDKSRMITTVQNIVIDDRFAVDVDKAPAFCEEIEIWQKDPKTDKEVDKFNHAMASWRYGIFNAEAVEGHKRKQRGDGNGAMKRTQDSPKKYNYGDPDADVVNYGSVAFSGGSQVPLDPQFSPTGLS